MNGDNRVPPPTWKYRAREIPYGIAVEAKFGFGDWKEVRRYLPNDEVLAIDFAQRHDGQDPEKIDILWESGLTEK